MGDAGATILVVDDSGANRYLLASWLRRDGHAVIEAATGREALDRLTGIDLVVLDVRLPDLSGIEVCERIKSDPVTAAIPVLQISAVDIDVADRARGLQLGADAYLAEPLDPEEFLATVAAALRYYQARCRAERTALRLTALIRVSLAINSADTFDRLIRSRPRARPRSSRSRPGSSWSSPRGSCARCRSSPAAPRASRAARSPWRRRWPRACSAPVTAGPAMPQPGSRTGNGPGWSRTLSCRAMPAWRPDGPSRAGRRSLSRSPGKAWPNPRSPLLLVADGTARYRGEGGTLLGIDVDAPHAERLVLPPGGTILMLTDGLIEDRRTLLDDNLERLRAAATQPGDPGVDAVADRILALFGPREDDVALIVLRRD